MGKTRPPYPPEFRRRMVELVRSGRSPEQLAQGCGLWQPACPSRSSASTSASEDDPFFEKRFEVPGVSRRLSTRR
jgi:transposase-like protein